MNLIAHQLLSFKNPAWQAGNFMGEVVKGNKYLSYDVEIAKGILLHRFIDSYTDEHPIVRQCTAMLHHQYGKYSGIIIDIFFDFLLYKNWTRFSADSFYDFKLNCYKVLHEHKSIYPLKLKKITDDLIFYDWFLAYTHWEGINLTLQGVSRRSTFSNNMHSASKDLYILEDELNLKFLQFFPDLQDACKAFIKK